LRALRCRVEGRVQRVGFRRYVLEAARRLKVSGYVRNELDDSVTIFAQGDEEVLQKLIEAVKSPPPPAKVESVEVVEAKPEPKIKFFEVKYGRIGDELQEGFGAMQSVFLEYWGEFRDYRNEFKDFQGEFKDFRKEFKDFREEFKDFRKEFQEFRGEFRDFREEFRGFARVADENFKFIAARFSEVSEKLTAILETLLQESKKTSEMLEALRRDSKETREMLVKALTLLEKAVEVSRR